MRVSLVRERAEQPYPLRHGGDVAGLVRAFLGDDPRERLAAVYLDTRHRPIAVHDAHIGTCDSSPVHPREVFGPAVALAATAIVVAHNHPSGD
ncbi:MAG: DNA repair protein RadC, partial [Planctomycetes bacterium]|nr:DNA repair protein RadC [Planctomycetota bacterium]